MFNITPRPFPSVEFFILSVVELSELIDTDKAFVKEVIQAIIQHGVQYHFAFPTLIFVVLLTY